MKLVPLLAAAGLLLLPGCIFDGAGSQGDGSGSAVYAGPGGGAGGSARNRTGDAGRGTTDPGTRFATSGAPIGGLTVETPPMRMPDVPRAQPLDMPPAQPVPVASPGTPPPPPPPPLDPRR